MTKEIRQALVFAGLILGVAFLGRLALKAGLVDNNDFAQRMSMVVLGFWFVATGNLMPKLLKPLRNGQCDPAKIQAFQRFHGWTWVMTGLTFAMVWLVLPIEVAESAGVTVIITGTLLVATRLFLLARRRRRET